MFEGIKLKTNKTVTPVKTQAMEHSSKLNEQSSHSASKQDMAELSRDWQKHTDWNVRTNDTLYQLQQSYPDINILLSEKLQDGALALTAAALGSGTHLILTEDFLQEMGKSQENYNKYKEKLIQILNQLSADSASHSGNGAYVTKDGLTYWHGDRAAKEEGIPGIPGSPTHSNSQTFSSTLTSSSQKKQDYRITSRPSYKTAGSYARLAAASSKPQVQAVLGQVQRNLTSLRISAVYGEDSDRQKAKAAIASLNKLLLRGGQKMRRLSSEEITRLRHKRALQREQQEKAARIKAELAKKRTERSTSDGAIVLEGRLNDIGQDYYHKKYKAYDTETITPTAPPPFYPDIPAAGLLSPDTAFAFAPSEVVISETISLE